MATTYVSLAEAKARLSITDSTDDGRIASAVEAASRLFDSLAGRRFYTESETRYYQTTDSLRCAVDDLTAVTALYTDEDGDRVYEYTWATTDYDLLPANAVEDGQPYTAIRVTPDGVYVFPVTTDPKAIKIVGTFGHSASVPDDVREATALLAEQIFKRKDTIYGVQAGSGFNQQIRQMAMEDPFIRSVLMQYRSLT